MIPNQRNIELMIVSENSGDIQMYLASDSAYTTALDAGAAADAGLAKDPVVITRSVPGDPNFLRSDVITWNASMKSTIGLSKSAAEDVWTLASLNTIVDGDNPARELNLRVWPVGLSSVGFQQLKNTGHFIQLDATRSAISVAQEFASILDANYSKQRENGSGGLHCGATSAVSAAVGSITGTDLVVTFKEGKDYVGMTATALLATSLVAGDYITDGTYWYEILEVVVSGAVTGYFKISMPAVADITADADSLDQGAAAADVLTAAAGLTVFATPNKFVVGSYNWEKTRLQLTSSGMGVFNYTTMAFEGVGTYPQIAEREWFLKGNEGKPFRTNAMAPVVNPTLVADSGELYDEVFWTFSHDMLGDLGKPNNSPKMLSLATLDGEGATIKAVIDAYIAQA